MTNELFMFWKEIKKLSYASGVWNYKDNNFDKIALKYGLYVKCNCNIIHDITEVKFCSICGKKLK